MTNLARAFADQNRTDIRDAVSVLCAIAGALHTVGWFEKRDESIVAAADLLADLLLTDPSRFGEAGVQ
jgi:hypothetical protein